MKRPDARNLSPGSAGTAGLALIIASGCVGVIGDPDQRFVSGGLTVVTGSVWHVDSNDNNTFDDCTVDLCLAYGSELAVPLIGDWDGDGLKTMGAFDRASATFLLDTGQLTGAFVFGEAGDIPLAGDWNGDGIDTVAVFTPALARFRLAQHNGANPTSRDFVFGLPGDLPVAGDWDGDGQTGIGVYRQTEGRFLLRDAATAGTADVAVQLGTGGNLPLGGDWNGDGLDTVGLYHSGAGNFTVLEDLAGPARTVSFGVAHGRPTMGRISLTQ